MKLGDIFADSAELDSFSGTYLRSLGFTGCIPYVGIGGGSTLPHKRLTREAYLDYRSAGLAIPAVFVELNTYDADGGYSAGVANAHAALLDLGSLGIDATNMFVIACNDKTEYTQADLNYMVGFHSVWGSQTGVYGFSNFLLDVYKMALGIGWYHQCGSVPSVTKTDFFVNVWQDNNYQIQGIDVNHVMRAVEMSDPLDEQIQRQGTKPDGTPESGTVTPRAILAWSDYQWDTVNGKLDRIIAALTQLPVSVNLTDPQVGQLGVSVVNEAYKRLGGTGA